MLLRSSSAPFLSALVSEGDNDASASNRPFLHSRGLSSKLMPSMRKAHSEGDLQGLIYPLTDTDDQIGGGQKKQYRSKLSNIQEKEQLSACISEVHKRCLEQEYFTIEEEGERLSPLQFASGIGMPSKTDALIMNGGGDFYGCNGRRGSSGGCDRPSRNPHGDASATDLHYQKLLETDPQNPLFLRNYAQFLSEAKKDYNKSGEYYERAILACPNDGEVLSMYAKHVWDVHKDSERAGSYFDQAVKAMPDDCYVLASYAAFLWQSEEDEEEMIKAKEMAFGPLPEMCATHSPLIASG